MLKKQTRKLLKTLRSNNGGEYISNAFNQFCRDNGITRQLIVPYTLEQNGVIEQKNRSLQECVRSMLKQAKLFANFWAKAIGTTVYLQNKTLIKALAKKTLCGHVRNHMWHISKCLGVKPMLMSQKKIDKSWIQSLKNVSS